MNNFVRNYIVRLLSYLLYLLRNRKYSVLTREEVRNLMFSFSQFGEDRIVEEIVENLGISKGLYVDAGAFHPYQMSVTNLLYRKGWKGIVVDLNQDKIALFKKYRPRDIAVCAALSDKNIEYKHLKYDTPAYNKIVTADSRNLLSERGNDPVEVETIRSKTLNDIIDQSEYKNTQIDVLNIDCEGADLDVLKGIDIELYQPKIIVIEANKKECAKDIYEYLLGEHDYSLKSVTLVSMIFVHSKYASRLGVDYKI